MNKKLSVEITIPVYNEEVELADNVMTLHKYCSGHLKKYHWHISIADNASTDGTPAIGKKLAKEHPEISVVILPKKGRGRAVKKVWSESTAEICCYMDVDLSTDLSHIPKLIDALAGGYDIAIGSRLLPGSRVIDRTLKREFISRAYNIIVKLFFQTKFSDAQCGFKGVSRRVVRHLIPHIDDNEWFMDSELLIVAEKVGYKIYEEPVVWRDNPGSTVRVLPTAMGDLRGLYRLFSTRPWNRLSRVSKN